MSVLELDIGNSRCKWRLRRAGQLLAQGHCDSREITPMLASLPERPRVIWASCVAGAEVVASVEHWCAQAGVPVQWARSSLTVAGVRNGYQQPERLGVDRWLAIVAAVDRYRGETLLVVDAGSAMTLDLVDEQGIHLGGYILPGYRMMLQSLLSGTGLIREGGQWPTHLAPGQITADAVERGALLALIGAIEHCVASTPQSLRLVLTGGDAGVLMSGLTQKPLLSTIVHHPDLVLDGLQLLFHPPGSAMS